MYFRLQPSKPARRKVSEGHPKRSLFLFLFKGMAWMALLIVLLTFLAQFVSPPSTLMLGRWLTGEKVTRIALPLEEMGSTLPNAVIASEDARYCQHQGVDWDALHTVIEQGGMKGPSRGASTIPMQTAKNLFLWPGRSYLRKGMEIPLALWLDAFWTKRRMLEIYLNMAEWGEGIFGIEAAAQHYFHGSARTLNRQQIALLVTALPDPLHRNPARPGPAHRQMAATLAARMGASGLTGCLK